MIDSLEKRVEHNLALCIALFDETISKLILQNSTSNERHALFARSCVWFAHEVQILGDDSQIFERAAKKFRSIEVQTKKMASSLSKKFVRGEGQFIDDIRNRDFLFLSVLRSPYPHARIMSIDVSRALSLTKFVFTGLDVNSVCGPLPVVWTAPGMKMLTQPILASGKVRYIGEPVAFVLTSDPGLSKDAVELIDVNYETLPAVTDVEKALESDSPILHEEYENNVGLHVSKRYGNVDEAFKQANVVIREKFRIGRVAPVAMEGRGVVSTYDHLTGSLTVWSSTQIPYMLRYVLSSVLGIPENRIRVLSPNIGGGFGSKDSIYPEEVLASFASMRTGKPVKWVEDRTENLMATNHDRDEVQYVEAAATSDARITALKVKILVNHGAYYRFHGARMLFLVLYMLSGQYKIPNLDAEAFSILTNTMSTFPYRGPGSCEATFLIERVIDLVARRTGIDPAEARQRNLVRPDEFPYTTATGAVYDSGNFQECLRKALEISEYWKFRKELQQRRSESGSNGKYLGVGIGCYLDQTGMGPSKILGSLGIRQAGWEKATVSISQSGKVTVVSGIQSIGQGTEYSLAQIVAEELELPIDEITLLHGDTSLGSFGGGAFASRSLAVGGTAVAIAARKVKEKALKIASHMLEARLEDLIYRNGKVSVRGVGSPTVTIEQIANNSYLMSRMPEGMDPGLEASATFDPPNFTFSYGTIVVKVEVDEETGIVKPLGIYAVHDCGKVVTDFLVEGQMHGGIVQGLGEGLLEHLVYDKEGQLVTGTFNDYLIPTSRDVPTVTLSQMETRSPVNILGVKGAGESGIIGVPAAIANATEDALLSLGVRITQVPVDLEYIWQSVHEIHRNYEEKERIDNTEVVH